MACDGTSLGVHFKFIFIVLVIVLHGGIHAVQHNKFIIIVRVEHRYG